MMIYFSLKNEIIDLGLILIPMPDGLCETQMLDDTK